MNFSNIYKLTTEILTVMFLVCSMVFSFSINEAFAQFIPSTGISDTGKAKTTLPDPLTPEAARGACIQTQRSAGA